MGGENDRFQRRFNAHQRHDDRENTLIQPRPNFYLIDEQSGLLKVQLIEMGLSVD